MEGHGGDVDAVHAAVLVLVLGLHPGEVKVGQQEHGVPEHGPGLRHVGAGRGQGEEAAQVLGVDGAGDGEAAALVHLQVVGAEDHHDVGRGQGDAGGLQLH